MGISEHECIDGFMLVMFPIKYNAVQAFAAALANVVARAAGARAAAERSAYKELQRKIAIFNRLSSLRTLNIHER